MNVKKILALLLAAMMVLGMTSAMAADLNHDKGTEPGVYEGDATELTIKKSVVVENDAPEITVAYPEFTFTYAITPVPATELVGVKVTDDSTPNPVTVAVQPGKDNGFANMNPTATIAASSVKLNTNGQEIVSGNVSLTVVPANHVAPGIYRYKINEASNNLTTAGGVRVGEAGRDYFLDVYIGWDDPTSTTRALQVKGFVLSSANTTKTPTSTDKESGFDEVTVNSEGKLDPTAGKVTTDNDFYYTYNVSVKKVVTGTMGDTAHEFPFALAVANNDLNYLVVDSDAGTLDTIAKDATLGNTTQATLSHNDEVKIYGLSPKATIGYTETNDTDSAYTVTVENNAGVKSVDAVTTVKNATAVFAAAAITNYADSSAKGTLTDAKKVTFTNDLAEISPTGVVLRFAPYVAMFAAGCVLFLIFATKRSKKEEE